MLSARRAAATRLRAQPEVIGGLLGPLGALAHQRRELHRPAAAHVDARDALADGAHDLVGQRLAPRATSSSGSARLALVAEQHHLVADPGAGTSVRSTMVRSMVTRPTIGTRAPRTSIAPRFESSHE